MAGYRDARLYAYSNARVKAMESELIPRSTMDELSKMESVEPILVRLLQTSYKRSIEEYGGAQIRTDLVDFALSSELAKSASRLEKTAPGSKRDLILLFTIKFDIDNIKLMLDAKARNRSYEEIEHYLVETRRMSKALMRELFSEQSVEELGAQIMHRLPFKEALEHAMETYKKTKNVLDAENLIDKHFYEALAGAVKLKGLLKTSKQASMLVKQEIEMRNVLALLRAARYELTEQELSEMLIDNGTTPAKDLLALFGRAKDVEGVVAGIKSFDLKAALRLYQQSKNTQMLRFEIAMRNSLFSTALHLLRYSVLSFGTLVGYAYIKEMEVFALRTLVKARQHGLSSDEAKELIAWNK